MLRHSQWRERKIFQQLAIILVLVITLMFSAFMVVTQVFQYRHDYRTFNQLIRQKDDLNADWGRLLIEQQTFGATAQIGTRAVTQLRMYSPPASQTVVISTKK